MMVSKNNKYQKELLNSQQIPHYGLRKLGIGVASVLLGTTFYFGGNMANVHADATPAAAGNNDATQQQTNVNSAETNQTVALSANAEAAQPAAAATNNATSDSQAIDIAIDHSALNNAVSGAQKAGLETSEEPAKSNSTTLSNVATAKKAIEQEEQSQATNIENQTKAYQTNVSNLNSAAQDHSALDTAASSAAQVEGLTIDQGSVQSIDVDPTDDSAITNTMNQIANDYASQANEIQEAITTQEKNNQEYEERLEQYKTSIDKMPVIAQNEDQSIKLIGSFDTNKKGNVGYYSNLLLSATNLPKDTVAIKRIAWGKNTEVIGGAKVVTDPQYATPDDYYPDTKVYDISDQIKNNGSIILTNFAQDTDGQNYDLKLTFKNTYNNKNPHNVKQLVTMGQSTDGSGGLSFVYYDGFNGVSISSIQFLKDGKPANVLVSTAVSDVDNGQGFNGTLANEIAYAAADSGITINKDGVLESAAETKGDNFSSSPVGVALLVGLGNSFSFNYDTLDLGLKTPPFDQDYNPGPDSTLLTLFGNNTTISTEPIREVTHVSYHYDQVNPKQAKPITYHYNTLTAYNDQQAAQVIYRDKTENYKILHEGPELSGYPGTQITDSSVDGEIKALEDQGYVLSNNGFPSDAAFDNDNDTTQTFYIDFVHGTQPITPTTPGTPGQPINPNDPNSPKYPGGTDKDSLTKTIIRTIHYVGAGNNTPKDVQQPVTFTQSGVIDKVTGEWIEPLTWSSTKQDVEGVKTPVIDGYHVTNVDKDSQDKVNVDKVSIHNDDNNYTVTVTYAPNGKIIPVDPNGKPIPNAPTPQYPTDPNNPAKVTPDEPVPNIPGWTPSQPTVTPVDPGTDTDVVYHVPAKDEGVVNVFVHDNTTGQNLINYYWTSGTENVGTKVNYDKSSTIKELVNSGYKVLNPEVTIPGEITKGEQNVTIYVEHTTTTVTPDTPGKPGEPVDPTNPNGPKYPGGTDINSLKKTGTQTIHYVGAGDKTPADNKQSFDFTKTITFDNVTGKIINDSGWNVSSHTFGRVDTPVVQGYHADKTSAGETTITPDDLTKEVTVTYAPNGKIIPVDPNGKPIPNTPTPQYPTDPTDPTKVTPDEPVPNVPGMTPETPTVTPKDPGKDTQVIYNVPTKDEGIVNVFVHDNTTGQNLSDYGWTSGTQKTGTKVDFDKPGTIAKLENAGYKVINPDVTIPGEITKGENSVTIYVEHGTVPVDPKNPGKPGQPINPNKPDGPKYPDGTNLENLTKTITRTIHYTGAGENTPKDVQQTVTFTQSGVIDKVTGEWITPLTWNSTSQNVAGEKTPVIDGYHVINVDRDSQDKVNVDGATIKNTDSNYIVTVTYAKNGKIVPVDPNGKPIPNVPTPQYPTDPSDPSKVTPNEPVPNIPGMTPETPTVTPTDPGKDTQVIYNVPTKDEGVVTVIVTDTTTGQNLPDYGWTSGTQKTGTKVDFDKPGTITKLENAGYKVLNPDVTVPGEITKGKTTVVIRVAHGTTTVTPDKPGTPGQPIDPKNPNGPKYPGGTDINSLKKTGTQTIHYVGAGDKTPADNKQSFDFTKTITFDNVTGKIISDSGWNVANHTFDNVDTPVVPGYHADKASAGGTTITPTDLNKEVTVTYTKNGKIIPVDPNGKPIPDVPTPQYPTDPSDPTKVTPDEPVPTVPGMTPETPTVTPKNPGKDTEVTYNVPTKDEGVVNVIVTDTTTGRNLTDYGWTSGTQKTGTKVDFDKPGTIKKLEDAGYKVTNPDVTVPGEITKGTTNVVIKVEHQIVPVTPDKPGNGLKNTDLTKTVTETVHYVGAGDQTPTTKTTQLHFTGTAYYDAVTGKWTDANGHELKDQTKNITWTAEDGNKFAAVATPAIDGYTAKVQDGYDDGNGNVKELSNIEPTSGNIDVTVTYTKNGQPTTPNNPENPNTPTNPENPSTPTNPENPNKPTNPNTPTNPENPNTPTNPENPTDNPNGPETPANPGTPTNSNTPNGQLTPVYPGTSTGWNTPAGSTSPMNLANSGANGATVQPLANNGAGYAMNGNQSAAAAQGGSALPQTGNNDAVSAAALGLMGLAVATGLGLGAAKKRHE